MGEAVAGESREEKVGVEAMVDKVELGALEIRGNPRDCGHSGFGMNGSSVYF